MAQLGRQDTVNTLSGNSVYESNDKGTLYSSYGGGGEMVINGYGFDDVPDSNQIIYETSELSSSTVRMAGKALN